MRRDGRKLARITQAELRKLAIKRVVEDGEEPSKVIAAFDMCRTTIYRWLRAFKKRGDAGIAPKKATGRPPKLTARQKRQVMRWMNGRDPRQYGFDFGLWTRKIVAQLIKERFNVDLGVTAVGRLLAGLGITPQKPLRRAYERDPIAIERWKREEYPALKERADKEGADIFFLDEAGVRSDQVLGRTWAPRGKTPEVPTSGQRQSINAISAVTALGAFWFVVFAGKFNAVRFVEFLKSFMKGRRRPVFLVLDGHPSHRAKLVLDYVKGLGGRLEFHFLPGYAPELNPDEFVWNYLKKEGVAKKPLKKGESLRERIQSDLVKIKCRPALVRSFFGAPTVAYI
jgi:transposase